MLLSEVFYPEAPRAWLDFVGLFLLFALLRLLPRMLPQSMRSGAYFLALLYFLHKIMDLAPEGNLVNRLALFAVSVTGAASCRWFYERLRGLGENISDSWAAAMVLGGRVAFAAFSVAAIANVVGAVGLSIVIVEGVLSSMYAAILVWVAAVFLRALVRVALLTATAGVTTKVVDCIPRGLTMEASTSSMKGIPVFREREKPRMPKPMLEY